MNCQSLKNKSYKILGYLEENKVNVACLQETWLKPTDKSVYRLFQENGYKIFKRERTASKGGGLAILYNPELNMRRCYTNQDESYETFEYISCKFIWGNKQYNLVNMYRLPYSQKHRFTVKKFFAVC